MALQSLNGGMWIPSYEYFGGSNYPLFNTGFLIDADGEKLGIVFRAPKAGDLAKVRIRFGTVVKGADTTLKVSFQTVDLATGFADGTPDEYRVIAVGDIVSDTALLTGLITADGTDGGAKRTVSKGELVACVVEFNKFNASDSITLNTMTAAAKQAPNAFEYPSAYAGTWGKSDDGAYLSVEYSDESYAFIPGVWPALAASTQVSYKSDSAANVIGLKFRLPAPCKIGGCWLGLDADGDFNVNLYTASGVTTVASNDKDARVVSSGIVGPLLFTAEQTLAANTDYVLAVVPTTTTALGLGYIDVTAAAELDQLGGGQAFHYATAASPSTTADFTATTTRRPMIGLLVTAIDDGVQTGGGGGFPILGGSIVR